MDTSYKRYEVSDYAALNLTVFCDEVIILKKDAYMTAESVFVVPTIFVAIMLLIFMGIVMYQQSALYSLAARSASRASMIYVTCANDMETGKISESDFKNRNPYRYIWDSEANNKVSILNSYVAANVGNGAAYMGVDKTGTYASRSGALFKKLYVKINMDYNNPIKGLARMFGIGELFKVDVFATAPVSEPVELIRNVDIAGDLLNRYASGAMEKLSGIKNKIMELSNILKIE